MIKTSKTALVTGASRGIGKAIALQLADAGYDVVVHFNENRAAAELVAEAIRLKGQQAYVLQANLFETAQAIRLGEQAWDLAGGLDVLVNNAGASYKKHFLDVTEADFDQFDQVNFRSVTFLTQSVARNMVKHSIQGSIWAITSVNGIRPGLGLALYGATKGAVETLMKGVAMELGPHNIRVNTLAVGAVQTDINRAVWENPALLREVNEGIPAGRLGLPEEIARILVDLIGSGSYMTGSTITIDGGLLLMRGYGKPKPYELP
jgi:NAD(P)-dependent dehydrogenase (short-subunit alcohol dehydrogenase family)